ncbi:MAG: ribonuclease III domain-containing protein, partial [Longicatena sp.]
YPLMDVRAYNGTSLAYIGDAVMSLYVREKLLSDGYQQSKILQKESEKWVSAKAQSYFLMTLENQHFFHEDEWNIVLRGRNTNPKSKAKNADVLTYRKATGLEAIFGYLYLNKQTQRLDELWQAILTIGEFQ